MLACDCVDEIGAPARDLPHGFVRKASCGALYVSCFIQFVAVSAIIFEAV